MKKYIRADIDTEITNPSQLKQIKCDDYAYSYICNILKSIGFERIPYDSPVGSAYMGLHGNDVIIWQDDAGDYGEGSFCLYKNANSEEILDKLMHMEDYDYEGIPDWDETTDRFEECIDNWLM